MTEQNNKTYLIGFILALSAGLIWSFGAPTVRYMIDAQIYQWHYLFCRGITVEQFYLFFYFTMKVSHLDTILKE